MVGCALREITAFVTLSVLAVSLAPSTSLASPSQPVSLYVDATGAARRLLHSELVMPVHAGPLTLVYPRWGIPTYEAPVSVVDNIVGLKIFGDGRPIEWRREPADMFAFHVDVPIDVRKLTVSLDVIAPSQRSDLNAATGQLLVVDWQTVVLYPTGAAVNDLPVKAQLRLPPGWTQASSLKTARTADGVLEYLPVSLATLVDSPVLAGKYLATFKIGSHSEREVFVNIGADVAEAAALPEEWQERIRRVVDEAGALFGGYPYRSFHFLVALSDQVGNDGLEHRESTDIRLAVRAFSDDDSRLAYGYLIPHEYVHSWNGKFCVPAGLVRRDFQAAQTTELLWVYEGFTRYLNWVLAARAGILSEPEARDYAALLAAKAAHRSGREWRSLQDTAVSAGSLNDAPDQWESLRRGTDYYDEALLIWLEADVTIRRLTGGRRSLDDFCRSFFGPPNDPPLIRTYRFDDVVAALDRTVAYDWRAFLRTRLDATGVERAPLEGLSAGGWNLAYQGVPGSVQAARDKINKTVEERFSLGILLGSDGGVIDVVRGSPAWNAGIGPGMKVLAVNTRPWTGEALRAAIAAAVGDATSLQLTVQNGSEVSEMKVDYHLGARYPRLERNEGDDVIGAILQPRVVPLVGMVRDSLRAASKRACAGGGS